MPGMIACLESHRKLSKCEFIRESTATHLIPVASVFIAAGRVFKLWRGGVSAIIQHVIRQVCEQFVQLRKNSACK